MNHFNYIEGWPDSLSKIDISQLKSELKRPSLIYIRGKKDPPLFVSTLLHGNEHTGFLAMQRLINQYLNVAKELPRSLYLFLGNIEAASENNRKLSFQQDYNRIWKGGDGPEFDLAKEVTDFVRQREIFASIDIHNNTGKNPHYSCISKLEWPHINLASLFTRTMVYFTHPDQAQSICFSEFLPAVTIECGLSGDEWGIKAAQEYVDACLHLNEIPTRSLAPKEIDLYETIQRVVIPASLDFSFEDDHQMTEVVFRADFDSLNFCEQSPSTELGSYKGNTPPKLIYLDHLGQQVDNQFFLFKDGKILFNELIVPSMFTKDKDVIRKDCLGYLMRHKSLPKD